MLSHYSNLIIFLAKLPLKPAFLLVGNVGSGKELLIAALADHLGMHYYKIDNFELMANVYAQNETKLHNAFFNAKMAAPCIISMHNFEVNFKYFYREMLLYLKAFQYVLPTY